MKVELFPFQRIALFNLRQKTAEALGAYRRTHTPQVVSFTAPTGAGKTIILASLIETIYFGDEQYPDQPEAIFVWLSDSPELNEQSKGKIDLMADRIALSQCVTITDDSFDQEMLDDGHIYFLNTQKLGKSSNLTKKGDGRNWTIWETLKNTIAEKYDRLYFIIDEAHRGMQGNAAAKATTIMQKFIKGSREDNNLPPSPVVLGVSATPERFNNLVAGTESTISKVIVSPADVKASGLLKDRIIIAYPEDTSGSKDMAVLQAAADDWKQKWDHWAQYCQEQHYAYVNPVFVIQVQNQAGGNVSETDLADCLQKIEERTGFRFESGEVVHTFGQTSSTLVLNGIDVQYLEPSRIADERKVKVVFFKENLSTGWDCPRAETMMSFRHAVDSTYIAQLLGRMVRTPMQMRIQVDDVLNDVHLFLPYFNATTVKNVVDALQSTEGGEIPTDVYGENFESGSTEIWSVRPQRGTSSFPSIRPAVVSPGQITLENLQDGTIPEPVDDPTTHDRRTPTFAERGTGTANNISDNPNGATNNTANQNVPNVHLTTDGLDSLPIAPVPERVYQESIPGTALDREAIVKTINDAGLLTYQVRNVRISDYLKSLFALSRLLTQSGLYPAATYETANEIVEMIHAHIKKLHNEGKYDNLASKVLEFKLKTQAFDVFGETVDDNMEADFFSTTDTDIERQYRLAEVKLGNEGISTRYGHKYYDEDDPNRYKIDVIIYAADDSCFDELQRYAKETFHSLDDTFRRRITTLSDRYRDKYDSIVANGDLISKHNFRLPENIAMRPDEGGRAYTDHLFVNREGKAVIKLNGWEEKVIQAEQAKPDYVCWLRNQPRASWALCIPYKMNAEVKRMFPDFLIIRKDEGGLIVDILEPHDPSRLDNLGKAQGMAEYARENPGVGRIQLIRVINGQIKRLDMSRGTVRTKVLQASSDNELIHIFDDYSFAD